MKVVINRCFGGFGLSYEAVKRYFELKGWDLYAYDVDRDRKLHVYTHDPNKPSAFSPHYFRNSVTSLTTKDIDKNSYWYPGNVDRSDPALIQVVEELGELANGNYAELKIVTIPDNIQWEIDDYDGKESIHELHDRWS